MFYVACPLCHIGFEISATASGPDCAEFGNVGHCPECDETFFFDVGEVVRFPESQPTMTGIRTRDPAMHYVICPECQAQAEVSPDAVGPERTWLFNVTYCDECGLSFLITTA